MRAIDLLFRLLGRLSRAEPLALGLLVAAAGWVLDQATKAAAVRALGSGEVVGRSWPVYLQLTYNEGAAFGLPVPWWVFPIVTIVVVVLVVRHLPHATSLAEPFAYGLLLAGALGNITDRYLRPDAEGLGRAGVVDFIASDVWPTFNVADICISIGFVLLVIAAYLHERDHSRDERPGETAGSSADTSTGGGVGLDGAAHGDA